MIKLPQAAGVWKNEFLGRAAGEYAAGSKPFYYYFGVMFVYFLPFSAFIPLALAAPFYRIWEKKREAMFYLWLWFVAGIVIMSFCGGKRQHYILPLMPAMAVLAGIIIDDMIFVNKAYSRRFAVFFLLGHIVAAFALCTGAIIWLLRIQPALQWPAICAVLFAMVILAVAAVLFRPDKRPGSIICLFVGLCIMIFVWPAMSKKSEDENYIIMNFAQRVTAAADKPVITYCKVNPSFIYYFGHDVPVVCDIDGIYARYSAGCGIIAAGDNFEQLKNDSRFRLYISGLDGSQGFFVKDEKNE